MNIPHFCLTFIHFSLQIFLGLVTSRVINGPTSSGPNPKINLKPKPCPKKTKVKLRLKNLTMLPSYFDSVFVHLRQKARLRPELSPKFLSTLGPTGTRPDKPGLTYNSESLSNLKMPKFSVTLLEI